MRGYNKILRSKLKEKKKKKEDKGIKKIIFVLVKIQWKCNVYQKRKQLKKKKKKKKKW